MQVGAGNQLTGKSRASGKLCRRESRPFPYGEGDRATFSDVHLTLSAARIAATRRTHCDPARSKDVAQGSTGLKRELRFSAGG